MRLSWRAIVAGTAASVGVLVLGVTALTSSANAQTPTATPTPATTSAPAATAAATAAPTARPASAPSPPNRFFGTVTLNGQRAAAGTAVTAAIGSATCGSGTVSATGTYTVDVASA